MTEKCLSIRRGAQPLISLVSGVPAIVIWIDQQQVGQNVSRRLAELGFLPGEAIHVLARMAGGDPIAVRIGSSTFALRRLEASSIYVQPQPVLT